MITNTKIPLILTFLIFSCVVFVSCERIQDTIGPVVPDIETMTPGDIPDEENMMEMVGGSPVVINELMADNDNIIEDPQGDNDDWLELHNLTDSPVILTGIYLSDKEDNPTKWQFPDGTMIPANGYLIVWLDEDHDDEDATEGLHANFKLSKSGEIVMLVGSDADGNMVLDRVSFGEQETDVSYGRIPNGTGEFQVVNATPGEANTTQ